MTISTHAFGAPVTILPARPRTRAARRRKPVPRQVRARRFMVSVGAVCAAAVVVGTAQQIAAHGWKAFVFRAPGVGGTPARAEAAKTGTKPASSTPQLVAPPVTTNHHDALRARDGWSHRRMQLSTVPPAATASSAMTTTHQPPVRPNSTRTPETTQAANPPPEQDAPPPPSAAGPDAAAPQPPPPRDGPPPPPRDRPPPPRDGGNPPPRGPQRR